MYPDFEFYLTVFGGAEDEDIIMPFLRSGADIMAGCVCGEVPEEKRETFLRAACAQGEYMLENEGLSSVKLGDFSASSDCGRFSPRAIALLEGAGLFYRGMRGDGL